MSICRRCVGYYGSLNVSSVISGVGRVVMISFVVTGRSERLGGFNLIEGTGALR